MENVLSSNRSLNKLKQPHQFVSWFLRYKVLLMLWLKYKCDIKKGYCKVLYMKPACCFEPVWSSFQLAASDVLSCSWATIQLCEDCKSGTSFKSLN